MSHVYLELDCVLRGPRLDGAFSAVRAPWMDWSAKARRIWVERLLIHIRRRHRHGQTRSLGARERVRPKAVSRANLQRIEFNRTQKYGLCPA